MVDGPPATKVLLCELTNIQVRQRSVIVRNNGCQLDEHHNKQQLKRDPKERHCLLPNQGSLLILDDLMTPPPALTDSMVKLDRAKADDDAGGLRGVDKKIFKHNEVKTTQWPQALHWGFARQLNPAL